MQKDPNARFANCSEVLEALESASSVTSTIRKKRKSARNQNKALLATIALGLLVIPLAVTSKYIAPTLLDLRAQFIVWNLGSLPQPANKAECLKLNLQQQKQIVEYWRLRIDAALDRLKIDPEHGEEYARRLATEFGDYVLPDDGGKEYLTDPDYDELLLQLYRLTKGIPTAYDYSDGALFKTIAMFARQATIRAVFTPDPALVKSAQDTLGFVESKTFNMVERRELRQLQFRLYTYAAMNYPDKQAREKYLTLAEEALPNMLSDWIISDKNGPIYFGHRGNIAVIPYIRGQQSKARQILQEEMRTYLKVRTSRDGIGVFSDNADSAFKALNLEAKAWADTAMGEVLRQYEKQSK